MASDLRRRSETRKRGSSGRRARLSRQVGFSAAGAPRELRYTERVELTTFLRQIEDRVWSVTWRMTDSEHAHVVAEMRRAIITRYGSLDASVDIERTFTVRAFTPA